MNALTFDVEDYYQVSAFKGVVRFEEWDRYESRVEKNTSKILELLSTAGVHATFFVLGWEAERHPGIVKAIQRAGHEVAAHGYGHETLTSLRPAQFRHDIRRAKQLLEDLTGAQVLGYRAPSFTITRETTWALSMLVEEGFVYDSSIFPIRHDVYGMPDANPVCHLLSTDSGPLWEVPPSTIQIGGVRVPIAGGGYFRLFPYRFLSHLLRRVERMGTPLVMYLHPWELDPAQPRIPGSPLSLFRHYVNLHRTEGRLIQLLKDFRFAPIREAIAPIRQLSHERALATVPE